MRSLSRVVREGMESFTPLPAPFRKWEAAQALLCRGAITVLAGPPGSGKTISALNIVNQLREGTLYVSNDSTRYTVAKRTYSMLTGIDQQVAGQIITDEPDIAAETFEKFNMVRFEFDSAPSIETIWDRGQAFQEVFGEYPPLTVVDIMMNVEDGRPKDGQNYWGMMPMLKEIAVEQNTALLAVHHTSEGYKSEPCPPRAAIMGKANQLPELIITQNMIGGNMFYAVVKNRNGPSDETGQTYFSLPVNPAVCQIEDVQENDVIFHDGIGVADSDKIHLTTDDKEIGEF